jgi:MFS family permease
MPPMTLSRDGRLLFASRIVRLFAYGFLSVVLVLYLTALGLGNRQIGLLLGLTLAGDTVISLLITTRADRTGRRRMLVTGAVLMLLAGVVFALTHDWRILLLAATIGVISPSGNEVGPFLPIEQVALSETITPEARTIVFSWYNLAGSFATAFGSLAAGLVSEALQHRGMAPVASYRWIVIGYAALGGVLIVIFLALSAAVETRVASSHPSAPFGVHRSRSIVVRLSLLFSLDSFAGGFVVQSIVAFWFHSRFGIAPAALGGIFFGANILAGISALLAARFARRFGLLNTMVFTHLPSNVLLLLVPLMPTAPLAIAVLLARFSISQMDVPTRQSYIMAVVDPDERSAAAGITGIARTIGASIAPVLTGPLLGSPQLLGAIFIVSGALKIVYDFLLLRAFRSVRADE